tara:strand:+ start:72 stop:248 length:177 start_codon:yes stop_codon:yes gene_type:complete
MNSINRHDKALLKKVQESRYALDQFTLMNMESEEPRDDLHDLAHKIRNLMAKLEDIVI